MALFPHFCPASVTGLRLIPFWKKWRIHDMFLFKIIFATYTLLALGSLASAETEIAILPPILGYETSPVPLSEDICVAKS